VGYGAYHVDGMDRGYAIADTCNAPDCNETIDRGLAHLCYRCTKYFCGKHLTFAFHPIDDDLDLEAECFAGESSQVCAPCAEAMERDVLLEAKSSPELDEKQDVWDARENARRTR
jgi:hypothetical protein